MSYQALYRAYRPHKFKDIVGQDVIVKTLQQSIKTNKISHAYLFSGPRGTGKTSVARILAKAINCEHIENGEPCQQCQHCLEITKGNHPDVIEIDAASNNGVDEIRDIRDKVKFLPGLLKFKVYIIDEVHMLSQGAFNALLKTLEEPPKHVVFILATTEAHKIPSTILSRCQRYDFKSISIYEMTNKLKDVVQKENIKITEESIITIAENAEGGMRDALSILDQAVSFTDDVISVEDVYAITGSVSTEKIIQLANYFEKNDITSALKTVSELLDLGKEPNKLVSNLLQFYRDCLLFKNADTKQLNKYIFEKQSFQALVKEINEDKILYYVNVLSDVSHKIRFSNNPRVYLDVAFIQMINIDSETLKVSKRVEELEHKVEALAIGGLSQGSETGGFFDDEKVSRIEVRLNTVINELNKLELHKLIQKVDTLEGNLTIKPNTQNYEPDLSYQNQLSDININFQNLKEIVELEKANISSLKEEMIQLGKAIEGVLNEIEALRYTAPSNGKLIDDNLSDSGIIERLEDLEDKLYKLISGTLQSQTAAVFGRSSKRNAKQITLFGDEIINISDLKEKETKDETPEEIPEKEEVINPISYINTTEKAEVDVDEVSSESEKDLENDVIKSDKKTERINNYEDKTKGNFTSSVVTGDMKEVKEVSVNNIKSKKARTNLGEYTTYDARIIEKILHDSRTEEARKDRDVINHHWKNLDKGISPSLISTAEILKEAIVGAVGHKELILVFDSASTVNQVMRPRFKDLAKKVFDHVFNLDIKYYMALPKETWIEKRTEYINQYNIGIKYPTLQPINNPELYEVVEEEEFIDDRQKTIERTIEIFGEDLVKVE